MVWKEHGMGRAKKYSPEQIVNLLRQIEVGLRTERHTRWHAGKQESRNRPQPRAAMRGILLRISCLASEVRHEMFAAYTQHFLAPSVALRLGPHVNATLHVWHTANCGVIAYV